MSTATADPATESTHAKPDSGTLFMSRRHELRLVMVKDRTRFDGEGNVIETIEGEHLAFRDGQLRVPDTERMRGEKGELLEVAKVRAFLENHHLNGNREEGFWRVDMPAPAVSEAEQERLTELSQDLDVAGIEAFIEAERAGWARDQLLGVASRALERAKERREAHDAELQQARAEGAKPRPKAG